ncbi:hypothetical protein [Cellulomonas biazotea]|uniref:SAF domain-containing protein n=1 Tax=Cellulomonas biazotea TaxID=1709 RepID=A0A402DU72_9CELL|nr:hypothetical protein [Cellulomonas biazotea]GCE77642.1 hypothetical protein CBZ_26980 [Cellulomonas biazotea]
MRATRNPARRTAAAALAVVAGAALAACAPTSSGSASAEVVEYVADYPSYESEAALVQASDVVVRGIVIATRVEQLLPEVSTGGDPVSNPQAGLDPAAAAQVLPVVVTVATVEVEQVLKGDVAVGSQVEVSQLGGRHGGKVYVDEETVPLQVGGTDYVLLLADHGADVPLDLVNPQQALYTVSPTAGLQPASTVPGVAIPTTLERIEALAAQ